MYGTMVIIHYPNEVTFISKSVCMFSHAYSRSIVHLADEFRLISLNLFDVQNMSEDPAYVPRPPCELRKTQCFLTLWLQGEMCHLEFATELERNLIHQALQHVLVTEVYQV